MEWTSEAKKKKTCEGGGRADGTELEEPVSRSKNTTPSKRMAREGCVWAATSVVSRVQQSING